MCHSVISEDPFSIRCVPGQYEPQQMCDKAVDDYLAALTFVPDWFFTSKMINKHFIDLYADKNILYFDKDSGNFVFYVMRWVFLIKI